MTLPNKKPVDQMNLKSKSESEFRILKIRKHKGCNCDCDENQILLRWKNSESFWAGNDTGEDVKIGKVKGTLVSRGDRVLQIYGKRKCLVVVNNIASGFGIVTDVKESKQNVDFVIGESAKGIKVKTEVEKSYDCVVDIGKGLKVLATGIKEFVPKHNDNLFIPNLSSFE